MVSLTAFQLNIQMSWLLQISNNVVNYGTFCRGAGGLSIAVMTDTVTYLRVSHASQLIFLSRNSC